MASPDKLNLKKTTTEFTSFKKEIFFSERNFANSKINVFSFSVKEIKLSGSASNFKPEFISSKYKWKKIKKKTPNKFR
jgi:hypothetical protein